MYDMNSVQQSRGHSGNYARQLSIDWEEMLQENWNVIDSDDNHGISNNEFNEFINGDNFSTVIGKYTYLVSHTTPQITYQKITKDQAEQIYNEYSATDSIRLLVNSNDTPSQLNFDEALSGMFENLFECYKTGRLGENTNELEKSDFTYFADGETMNYIDNANILTRAAGFAELPRGPLWQYHQPRDPKVTFIPE